LNISVVEFEGHIECLYSFFKIFKASKGIKITAYISENLLKELEHVKVRFTNIEFIVKANTQSIQQFLDENLININQSDYIIFNTLQKQPHQYQLKKFIPKTIIRIHNINTFLNRKGNIKLDWNWYALYKDLSYFIREYLLAQQIHNFKRLLKETGYIMLPDNSYQDYIVNNKLYPLEKIFPCIPMAVYDPSFKKEIDEDVLTICITGTIDEKRKDYLLACEAIKAALPNIYGTLKLILLGEPKGPYGKLVLKKFNEISAANFELISFKKRVDQATFELYIKETDILVAPVVTETRYKFFKEVYGTTKISGSITDMIRYGKPLLLAKQYCLSKQLSEVIETFSNHKELSNHIIRLSKNNALLVAQNQKLIAFLKNYNVLKSEAKVFNEFKKYL